MISRDNSLELKGEGEALSQDEIALLSKVDIATMRSIGFFFTELELENCIHTRPPGQGQKNYEFRTFGGFINPTHIEAIGKMPGFDKPSITKIGVGDDEMFTLSPEAYKKLQQYNTYLEQILPVKEIIDHPQLSLTTEDFQKVIRYFAGNEEGFTAAKVDMKKNSLKKLKSILRTLEKLQLLSQRRK